jgi:hypothetical protein
MPKHVPSFSWGGPALFKEYEIAKAIETAKIVMKRRGIDMTHEYEKRFREVFKETARERGIQIQG